MTARSSRVFPTAFDVALFYGSPLVPLALVAVAGPGVWL